MSENRARPDQYQLRFPPGMRDALKAAAEENQRSMNAEIVARLQISMEADKLGWSEDNLRMDVIKQLEEVTKSMQYQSEMIKWMTDQQQGLHRLLEAIARTDGNLKPEFMEILRGILDRRGTGDTGFPKHPDDEDEE